MYIHLYHGRTDPNQQMEDWGEDGPTFGPFICFHVTFLSEIQVQLEEGDWLGFKIEGGLIHYGGMYYGDFEIVALEDAELGRRLIPLPIETIRENLEKALPIEEPQPEGEVEDESDSIREDLENRDRDEAEAESEQE